MIQLGHKLTRLSGVKEYGKRAGQVWAWVRKVGILDNVTAQVIIIIMRGNGVFTNICSGL